MADRFLARFRADPSKIRVTVRHFGDDRHGSYWRASIGNKETGQWVSAPGTTAIRAVVATFQLAEEHDVKGIDRHMGWAYDHPQGALAPPERACRVPAPDSPSTEGPSK